MQNPRRQRDIAGALVVVLALAAAAAFHLADGGSSELVRGSAVVGVTVAFFALCYAVYQQTQVRQQARLAAGVDVIARWQVDPARWREFLALDEALVTRDGALVNRLSPRASAESVEVIVAKAAVQVDGDYNSLGGGVLRDVRRLAGPPACIELGLLYTMPKGRDVRMSLRFPIAAGADAAAARVLAHYEAELSALLERSTRPLIAVPRPRLWRNVLLVVAVLGAAAFALGMALRESEELGNWPALAAGGGAIAALVGLVFAVVMEIRARTWDGS